MGNKGLIALIVIVVAVLSLPLLTSGDKSYTPEEVVHLFMEAADTGVPATVKPYITAKAWEASSDEFQAEKSSTEVTVYQGTSNEIEATVPALLKGDNREQTMDFLLRMENDKWLVYGLHMIVESFEITMDFENPEQMYEDLMDQAMEQIPAEMRSQITPAVKQEMLKLMKKEVEKNKFNR